MSLFLETNKGPSQRQLKVGEQIRQIISDVLRRVDFHNDLLATSHVCVGEVRMSPDLRHARAFITSLMGKNMSDVTKALNENEYHFRKVLSKELTMKFLPKIRFIEDDSFHEANKITSLLTSGRVAQDTEKDAEAEEPENKDD